MVHGLHAQLFILSDQHLSLPDNIRQLRGMLAGASQQKCLTPQVARRVVEGVTTGLLQHYRLFQYLFEEQQSEHHIDLSVNACAYENIMDYLQTSCQS